VGSATLPRIIIGDFFLIGKHCPKMLRPPPAKTDPRPEVKDKY
jgi:hypothetical protein